MCLHPLRLGASSASAVLEPRGRRQADAPWEEEAVVLSGRSRPNREDWGGQRDGSTAEKLKVKVSLSPQIWGTAPGVGLRGCRNFLVSRGNAKNIGVRGVSPRREGETHSPLHQQEGQGGLLTFLRHF